MLQLLLLAPLTVACKITSRIHGMVLDAILGPEEKLENYIDTMGRRYGDPVPKEDTP